MYDDSDDSDNIYGGDGSLLKVKPRLRLIIVFYYDADDHDGDLATGTSPTKMSNLTWLIAVAQNVVSEHLDAEGYE